MKTRFVLCSLLMIAAYAVHAADGGGQERAQDAGRALIGTPAPRLVLKTIDGATIDLGTLYGKQAVYLKFWATWCVPCRQQMPHFEHTYETAGPDLAVVAIDTGFNDSVEEVQKYRKQLGITMPIVVDDGTAGHALHLRVTPQHIVIGRDGKVLYVGHLADARLDAALTAARAAKPLPDSDAAGGANPSDIVQYQLGDSLSGHHVRSLDGKSLSLSDPQKRRPTVLAFLSPWCESYLATTRPTLSADCRAMREQINALASDSSVRWIGIASGLWASPKDLREYSAKYDVHIPLSLDAGGDRFRAFNVTHVPEAVLVDRNGVLQRRLDVKELAAVVAPQAAMANP